MCVLFSLVDIWVLSPQCLSVLQRGLSLWANPVNVPCFPSTLLSLQDRPLNCLRHTLDPPDPCFCLFVTPLARVLLVLFRLIWNLWFMPRWLSLRFWNVYASLNERFVVWYICSVLKLSWSVIIQELKDEYNEIGSNLFFWLFIHTLIIHHERLKIPHILTDQIVIVVLKTMSDLGFCTNIMVKHRFNYRWRF